MSAKELATQLKQAIEALKIKGTSSITCDSLISYLEGVIDTPSKIDGAELEAYKAELQLKIETEKRNHVADIEMFRSVIETGQSAVKSALLLNGGAAVALLAFIGKLTDSAQDKIPAFATPLIIFVAGALSIALASGVTYLSQWLYAESESWKTKTGFALNIVSILLGLSSFSLFAWGMFCAYFSFLAFPN